MAWQLTHAVMRHAPGAITTAERMVLAVIAEEIRLQPGSKFDPAGSYYCDLETDELLRRAGLTDASGLRKTLRRLAEHGVDIRVPLGTDKNGQPVYAYRGRVPRYRLQLPKLAPPTGCGCDLCRPDPAERRPSPDPPSGTEGGTRGTEGGPTGPQGGTVGTQGGTTGPPLGTEGGTVGTQGGTTGTEGGTPGTEGGTPGPPLPSFGFRESSSSPYARLAAAIVELTDADDEEATRLAATLAGGATSRRHPIRHPGAYARRMALNGDLGLALTEQRAADAARAAPPRPRPPALPPTNPSPDRATAVAQARELYTETRAAVLAARPSNAS